jgi:hypothetical protein
MPCRARRPAPSDWSTRQGAAAPCNPQPRASARCLGRCGAGPGLGPLTRCIAALRRRPRRSPPAVPRLQQRPMTARSRLPPPMSTPALARPRARLAPRVCSRPRPRRLGTQTWAGGVSHPRALATARRTARARATQRAAAQRGFAQQHPAELNALPPMLGLGSVPLRPRPRVAKRSRASRC